MDNRMSFTVGGNEFSLGNADVANRLNGVEPETIRELYVEVAGVKFPIKQAFAHVTGMQRGGFTSHDAMRVFRKLSLTIGPDINTASERYYTVIKSLNEFDKKEVHPVVSGLVAKRDRDTCFTGIYQRGKANMESLLSLRYVKDFQAIAMVTRSMFELAVDIKLIDVIPDAIAKIAAFSDVERLRAARKIVAFTSTHPASTWNSTIHTSFIKNMAAQVQAEQAKIWPGMKKVEHWSGLNLKERVKLLKEPFGEVYEVRYPQLSWYTHAAGLTGFNLKAFSFELLAASHFQLAGEFYMILLTAIIDEYELLKVDDKIKSRMKLAQQLPFTDTDDQSKALQRALVG
jgi:Family of unknown function (DUF5677)